MRYVPIDTWLRAHGQSLPATLPDPTASYLRWPVPPRADDAEPPEDLVSLLQPVLVAFQADLQAWQQRRRRLRGDRRPGVRKTLLNRSDLAGLVHELCRRYGGVPVVAVALGCSRQALRDVFNHHGLPAPLQPRRQQRAGTVSRGRG